MFEIEKDSYASYTNSRKVLFIIGEIGGKHDSYVAAGVEMSSVFLTKYEDELYVRMERALDGCRMQLGSAVVQMNIPVKMSKIYDVLRLLFGSLPDSFSWIIEDAKKYYKQAGEMVSATEMFFSENGLDLFLNKGVVMGGIAGFPGSVCEVFCDFMEHLEDLRIAYSVEETDERIREQMKRE